jgi:hypothetical protein
MAIFMLSLTSFAQKTKEQNIPLKIKNALHKIFPKAHNVKWDKEDENYEASFKVGTVDNSVLISANAQIVETEVEIKVNQLPEKALRYLKENFKNQKVKEAAKIVTEKGTITYEAEIGNADFLFDQSGNFIKKEKES